MRIKPIGFNYLVSAFLAWGTLGCSSPSKVSEPATPAERAGTIAFPLKATTREGNTYYLTDAVFTIRDSANTTVAELNTASDPEATVLKARLPIGTYTVTLQPGWVLKRQVDLRLVRVTALLSSPPVVQVGVIQNTEHAVAYTFVTSDETVELAQGTLSVNIFVEATGVCGDEIIDEGLEVCDRGLFNGRPNGCDAECWFVCDGPCPVRVDPRAPFAGDGSSWHSPLLSIQEAIEVQSVRGGGEVWVRGRGPQNALSARATEPLIVLREGVHVIGGFEGIEKSLATRSPDSQTTILGVSASGGETIAPLIIGDWNSVIEGFAVIDHDGTTLRVEHARDFHVKYLSISGGELHGTADVIDVTDMVGTFETLHVIGTRTEYGTAGLKAQESQLSVMGALFRELTSTRAGAGMSAGRSKLVLDGVHFIDNVAESSSWLAGLGLGMCDALVTNSIWLHNGPVSTLRMRDSRLVAVNSTWESNFADGPAAEVGPGSRALFLNSSFVENSDDTSGAIGANDSEVEVVNCAFYDNLNDPLFHFPDDVTGSPQASLSVYNSFTNRTEEESIRIPYVGGGYCFAGDAVLPYIRRYDGVREIYLRPEFGCTDLGDDAAARRAAEEAREFAAELGAAIPLGPSDGWWHPVSSVYTVCGDPDMVDPGRHYAPLACVVR
jgi:hypothetical protein